MFGVLDHRSGCRDGTLGDAQPMSGSTFLPMPDLSTLTYVCPKLIVSVDEGLLSALANTCKVRGGHGRYDEVGLRLWSYMNSTDP
eukprot:12276758-Karenia_brevis.AAC.1